MTTINLKSSLSALVLLSTLLGLSSCDKLLQGPDLLVDIEKDVDYALASEYKLTIVADSNGTSSPSGTIKVKDGFVVRIEASPSPEYELLGWKQTGGSGQVEFSAAGYHVVDVSLRKGDAHIAPVYEERPRVLYSLPTGNSIARNTQVRVIFNRELRPDSISTTNYRLIKAPSTSVDGTVSVLSGVSAIFRPTLSLGSYQTYVVSIDTSVKAAIDLADSRYDGVFVLHPDITMRQVFTKEFVTGASDDTTPPAERSPVTFKLSALDGDLFYTASHTIYLQGLGADDEGGVAAFWAGNAVNSSTKLAKPTSDDLAWQVLNPDVPTAHYLTDLDGVQTVNVYYKDGTGNVMLQEDSSLASIILDKKAPTLDSFNINPGAFAGYVNDPQVYLTLVVNDPPVASVKGSGESTNGSDTSNRKTYRLYDPTSATWGPWTTYMASGSLPYYFGAGASEGSNTARIQVRDGVGNSTEGTASIILDKSGPTLTASPASLYTNSTAVTLAISNVDPAAGGASGSGTAGLRIASSPGLANNSAWASHNNGTPVASGTLSGQLYGSTIPDASHLNLVLASGEGTKVINLVAQDRLGNEEPSKPLTLTLDTTKPVTGTFLLNGSITPPSTNVSTVTITVSGYNDPVSGGVSSGIAAMAITNTPSEPSSGWQSPTNMVVKSLVPGSNTFYFWVKDNAGNISLAQGPRTIDFDNTPPSGTATLSTSLTNNPAIQVNYTASVDTQTIEISNDGTLFTPFLKASNPSPINWNLQTDAGGSLNNGTRTVYVRFVDSSNNKVSSNPTLVFDNTAPTISSLSVAGGAIYTKNGIVSLSLAATDNHSSTANLTMNFSNNNSAFSTPQAYATSVSSWSLTSGNGGSTTNGLRTVTVKITDQAGNSSTLGDTITFDTVAPVISSVLINGTGLGTGNEDKYTNLASNMVDINASDATSGVSTMVLSSSGSSGQWLSSTYTSSKSFDITNASYGGTTAQGTHTVYVQVTDGAGNTSLSATDTIIYDTVAPVPTLTVESGNPAITDKRSGTSLIISATDTGGVGVHDMKLYNAGETSPGWETFVTTRTNWTLTPGNGSKGVNLYVRDKAGNVSLVNDSISLLESFSTLNQWDILSNAVTGSDTSYMVGTNFVVDAASSSRFYSLRTSSGNVVRFQITAYTASTITCRYHIWDSAGVYLSGQTAAVINKNQYFDLEANTNHAAATLTTDLYWPGQVWMNNGARYFEWSGN